MSKLQIIVILLIATIVSIIIFYYRRKTNKFDELIKSNFNHKIDDFLMDSKTKIVLSSDNDNLLNSNFDDKFQRDIFKSPPPDSLEAIFVELDKIPFTQARDDLDLIIDIKFDEEIEIKYLPAIDAFMQKKYKFYILEKNNWQEFNKEKKYLVIAIKLVASLIDKVGLISQAQILNIYNHLYKFALQKQGHIRINDYENNIKNIQAKLQILEQTKLNLQLFLITKNNNYNVDSFFKKHGFKKINNSFFSQLDDIFLYEITFDNSNYLSIICKLHLQIDPLVVIDKLFDFTEQFSEHFDARLLNEKKQLFNDKDYEQLLLTVNKHISYQVAKDINLIKRITS